MLNVLFLCTGNSARSILAEGYLNHAGRGRFRAFSAGSFPKGAVHPLALESLRAADLAVADARSKSWDEFATPSAPRMDLVITVCDNAAREVCPIWPGAPAKAHWSFPDPAAFEGSESAVRKCFAEVFAEIRGAVDRLVALPVESLPAADLAKRLREIGPSQGTARDLARCVFAEALGTAFLLIAIVGSGILGERLAGGNDAIALLANSLATGGALFALITTFAPISGAHFNPAVTLFERAGGRIAWRAAVAYVPAQIVGALAGVALAHVMFGLPVLQVSEHARATPGELVGEIVATLGLLLTIWGAARTHAAAVPGAVAAYIVGAYWFTSSTSFANPAVSIARSFTATFSGIAPASVVGFVAAELASCVLALGAVWLLRGEARKRIA